MYSNCYVQPNVYTNADSGYGNAFVHTDDKEPSHVGTGPKEIISLLRNKSRPYLFSNTIAPSVVGSSLKVFDLISNDSSYVERLADNTRFFREEMTKYGFDLSGDWSCPIVPVMLGDAKLAAEFADAMLERGVYVIGFSYPVVPKGQARIRTQLSAAHTREQIEQTVEAFVEVGRLKGVIDDA